MAPLQLFVVPPLVKRLGAVTWMRIGCLLGVSTFLATPNARFFSWNYGSLFAMTVASTTMINCCLAAVRALRRLRLYHCVRLRPSIRPLCSDSVRTTLEILFHRRDEAESLFFRVSQSMRRRERYSVRGRRCGLISFYDMTLPILQEK